MSNNSTDNTINNDNIANNTEAGFNASHKGVISQIGVFFGKFARGFIYKNDWLMIVMAVVIAALVGFALGGSFRVNREMTLAGAFAVVCVCLWNGSFNSIQAICKERDVVKREHRSGVKIIAYILAHMLYQFIICLVQTIVTIITFDIVGFDFSGEGIISRWLYLDIGITMFLITYAADMLSLFISSFVKSTTTAMVIMPFVLVFQLVLSGGLFPLPSVVQPVSYLTISGPGYKAISSQVDVNSLPYKSVTDMLDMINDVEFNLTLTGSDVIDFIADANNESNKQLRDIPISGGVTVREVTDAILTEDAFADLRSKTLVNRITIGQALDALANTSNPTVAAIRSQSIGGSITVRDAFNYVLNDNAFSGELRDAPVVDGGVSISQILNVFLSNSSQMPEEVNNALNQNISYYTNLGEVIDFVRTNDAFATLRNQTLINKTTVGEGLKILKNSGADILDSEVDYNTTFGEIADYLSRNGALDQYRGQTFTFKATLGELIDKMGREETLKKIEVTANQGLYDAKYEHSTTNVLFNWLHLFIFIVVFSIASGISLMFVDKDKR